MTRTPAIPETSAGRLATRLLWGCILLAFLAACFWHGQRHRQEQSHRSTELVLDYPSLLELARAQGKEWTELLPEFRRHGVEALAFTELRLEDLEGYGICLPYSGIEVGAESGLGCGEPPLARPQSTYLVQWGRSPSVPLEFSQLQEMLGENFGAHKVRPWQWPDSRARALEVDLPLRAVQSSGLGFPAWAIGEARKQGMAIWLRPENKPFAQAEEVRHYLERIQERFQPEGIIFGGASNEVAGYPDHLEVTAETLRSLGWKLGFIELPRATQQKGIETLVRQLPDRTARVFAVPPAQQNTLKPPRVAQMYSLAARERNLTVLYLRPYAEDPTPDKGFENANERLFESIGKSLQGRLGKAAVFSTPVQVPGWGLALLALGGGAALLLVVGQMMSLPLAPTVAFVLLFAGLNLGLGGLSIWRALMALGTACIFSTLAVVSQFAGLGRLGQSSSGLLALLMGSSLCWLRMFAISMVGAWISSAFLQDTTYKLGLDIFRGVKILTVGTPVLIVLAWMLTPHQRSYWLQLGAAPLRLYQLVGLALLAVAALIYTMRTGNVASDFGGTLEAEKHLRMVLDQALTVRPRFKEFLLAHPAMLMVPLWIRWGRAEAAALCLLAGTLGQCGLLDTFAHVHTPLQVSLIRCFLGGLLGLVLGWLYTAVLWQAAQVASRVKRKIPFST